MKAKEPNSVRKPVYAASSGKLSVLLCILVKEDALCHS
jgi:hypothetical protein